MADEKAESKKGLCHDRSPFQKRKLIYSITIFEAAFPVAEVTTTM